MIAVGAKKQTATGIDPKGASWAHPGDTVEISISGDSALLTQFAPMLSNPQLAGALGKLVRVGNQRAVQNQDGDIMMVVGNKVLINVQGSADAASKMAYAQAIDVAKLSKM